MKNKTLLIIILVLVCVLAAGIGTAVGILYIRSNQEAEADEEEDPEEEEEPEEEEPKVEQTEPAEEIVDKAEEPVTEDEVIEAEPLSEERIWRDALLSYMDEKREEAIDDIDNWYQASLIYVNDDDIPELVLRGTCEAEGNQIVTVIDGKPEVLQTNRLYYYYVEKGNALINSDGNSGYYHDYCYTIDDKQGWMEIGTGENSWDIDSDGEPSNGKYSWDGESVSKSEYEGKINEIIGGRQTRTFIQGVLFGKLYEFLKSDTPMSEYEALEWPKDDPSIHKYVLVRDQVSWYSALWDSADHGGYLVRINSKKEYDYICNQIESEGMKDCVFYTAGERSWTEDGEAKNPYRWRLDDSTAGTIRYENAMIDRDPELKELWMEGEPSYTGTDLNGKEVAEDCVSMFFRKKDNRFVLNDSPSDLTPYYGDRVAYIVEIE